MFVTINFSVKNRVLKQSRPKDLRHLRSCRIPTRHLFLVPHYIVRHSTGMMYDGQMCQALAQKQIFDLLQMSSPTPINGFQRRGDGATAVRESA